MLSCLAMSFCRIPLDANNSLNYFPVILLLFLFLNNVDSLNQFHCNQDRQERLHEHPGGRGVQNLQVLLQNELQHERNQGRGRGL